DSIFQNNSAELSLGSIIEYRKTQNFTLSDLPNVKYPKIKLFDNSGILHLTGRFNITHVVDGEKLSPNAVDYQAINTNTNESVYWDLFWWNYDSPSYEISFLESSTDEIIISFVAPEISNYFENEKYWREGPAFDRDAFNELWKFNYFQFAKFDPFQPKLENFVQFDQEVSQTENSDVLYPRLANTLTIPVDAKKSSKEVFLQRYIDNLGQEYIYAMIAFYDTTAGPKGQFDLEDGSTFWSGSGYSSFLFKIGNSKELVYYDYVEFVGTNVKYNEKSKTLMRDLDLAEGWAISNIYNFFIRSNNEGFEFTLLFSGIYQKSALWISNNEHYALVIKLKNGEKL
ncbi:MAG: hypothetical protein ACC656_12855, partial [Candidatus Heimdallarchaeota archaeon]